MATRSPAAQTETEKTAQAAGPSVRADDQVSSSLRQDAVSPCADTDASPELSYAAVDAINERYKPAKGLRVRSSL